MKSRRDYSKTALHIVQRFFPQVTKVDDGNEPVEVDVTAGDVKAGAKMEHAACAMAVACKRELKADGVIMSRAVAYIIRGDKAVRYNLPPSLARELVSFDRGGTFFPGSYALSRVNPARRLGADHSRKVKRLTSAQKSYQRHKPRAHITEGIRAMLGAKQ